MCQNNGVVKLKSGAGCGAQDYLAKQGNGKITVRTLHPDSAWLITPRPAVSSSVVTYSRKPSLTLRLRSDPCPTSSPHPACFLCSIRLRGTYKSATLESFQKLQRGRPCDTRIPHTWGSSLGKQRAPFPHTDTLHPGCSSAFFKDPPGAPLLNSVPALSFSSVSIF